MAEAIASQETEVDRALARIVAQRAAATQPQPTVVPAPVPTPVQPGPTPLPAAGWYVDPFDELQRRWWNGSEWTDSVRPVVTEQIRFSTAPGAVVQTDTRSSIRDLAADLAQGSAVKNRGRTVASAVAPGIRRGVTIAAAPAVPWFELPEKNPTATAGLVLGALSVLANPAGVVSIFALVLSGLGLARSGRTYLSAGRRRAVWGIALGLAGGLLWGCVTLWVLQHPEVLAFVGIQMS